jgi:hypothetical protein
LAGWWMDAYKVYSLWHGRARHYCFILLYRDRYGMKCGRQAFSLLNYEG